VSAARRVGLGGGEQFAGWSRGDSSFDVFVVSIVGGQVNRLPLRHRRLGPGGIREHRLTPEPKLVRPSLTTGGRVTREVEESAFDTCIYAMAIASRPIPHSGLQFGHWRLQAGRSRSGGRTQLRV
jgi:hypothetical protein